MTDEEIQRLQNLNVTGGRWFYKPFVMSAVGPHSPPKICTKMPDGSIDRLSGVDDLELAAHVKELLAEVLRLRSILSRTTKTADGVTVFCGDDVFRSDGTQLEVQGGHYASGPGGSTRFRVSDCYSKLNAVVASQPSPDATAPAPTQDEKAGDVKTKRLVRVLINRTRIRAKIIATECARWPVGGVLIVVFIPACAVFDTTARVGTFLAEGCQGIAQRIGEPVAMWANWWKPR